MDIIHTHCAGLDVHKKTVVVTLNIMGSNRQLIKKTRTFETVTANLLELSDCWLSTPSPILPIKARVNTGSRSTISKRTFENGQISEYASHKELKTRYGTCTKLYNMQADRYR